MSHVERRRRRHVDVVHGERRRERVVEKELNCDLFEYFLINL